MSIFHQWFKILKSLSPEAPDPCFLTSWHCVSLSMPHSQPGGEEQQML